MNKRRSFSAEFKAREALTGAHTMSELSAKHGVHPNMIAQWKRRIQEGLPELFARKAAAGWCRLGLGPVRFWPIPDGDPLVVRASHRRRW